MHAHSLPGRQPDSKLLRLKQFDRVQLRYPSAHHHDVSLRIWSIIGLLGEWVWLLVYSRHYLALLWLGY